MIKLGTSGAWLLNGKEVIEDGSEALAEIKAKTGHEVSKAKARQNVSLITEVYKQEGITWA